MYIVHKIKPKIIDDKDKVKFYLMLYFLTNYKFYLKIFKKMRQKYCFNQIMTFFTHIATLLHT